VHAPGLSHSFRQQNGGQAENAPITPTTSRRYAYSLFRPRALPPAFGFCLAALSHQSSALAGKGLKHHCSDLVYRLAFLFQYLFMKTNKVPRERDPFLLSGKRRWRQFHWIWRRTRRDGAANNLLSHNAKPV
jgi:hypothetical protein